MPNPPPPFVLPPSTPIPPMHPYNKLVTPSSASGSASAAVGAGGGGGAAAGGGTTQSPAGSAGSNTPGGGGSGSTPQSQAFRLTYSPEVEREQRAEKERQRGESLCSYHLCFLCSLMLLFHGDALPSKQRADLFWVKEKSKRNLSILTRPKDNDSFISNLHFFCCHPQSQ